ncbi:zinc finger and SCAN domain-containing protein 5B [Otolemur garnettii]|uniref:zinc finger and SCAN domain-containing protein 5B n=1 Tax=Otolemur garnettii TaxID=30611 RepID=UPI0006446456|nr:zinc finger and SCAN domain-containing protein 5B [Otolemur garnettii]
MAINGTSLPGPGKFCNSLGSEPPQLVSPQGTPLENINYDAETWHLKFRSFTCSEGDDPIKDLQRLTSLCHLWLRPDLHTTEQILDQLVLEQFLISTSPHLQAMVKENGVRSCRDLEDMLRNNMRPKKWSVVTFQGKEFLVHESDAEMADAEASGRDDVVDLSSKHRSSMNHTHVEGEDLLLSGEGDLESVRPRQTLEKDLEEDRKEETAIKSQEPQCPQGPDSVRAKDRKEPQQETCLKPVDAVTPPPRVSEREVSTQSTGEAVAHAPGRENFECGECNKKFPYESQLVIHQRAHSGERPFTCSCGKGFLQPSDLRVHQRIHTGEKPYTCGICSKRFTHQSTLYGHERIHTKERPYSCKFCKRSFSHKGNLNVHQRIHLGLRPFECSECKATFRQLGTFKRHLTIHSKKTSH